jgi:hypothetical protein
MSGYLQRIAVSVTKARAIHPMIDSVYATPHRYTAPEAVALEEIAAERISGHPHQPSGPDSAGESRSERALLPNDAPPDLQSTGTEYVMVPLRSNVSRNTGIETIHTAEKFLTGAEVARPGRPSDLFPTDLLIPDFVSAIGAATAKVHGSEALADDVLPAAGAGNRRTGQSRLGQRRPPPLFTESTTDTGMAINWTSPIPTIVRATSSSSGATLPDEPDSIEIHIGRIEVTAVPPAPASAASSKPRRETPSLSEYLKRRDAGTR